MAGVAAFIKDRRRLAWILGSLWLALLVPTVLLGYQVYQQLRFESMHQYRADAEPVAERIVAELQRSIGKEAERPVADYWYRLADGTRSPLAELDKTGAVPGLLGYFRLDQDGKFGTPLVPEVAANADNLPQRQQEQDLVRSLLQEAETEDSAVAEPSVAAAASGAVVVEPQRQREQVSNQVLFEKLSNTRELRSARKTPSVAAPVDELKLETAYYDQSERAAAPPKVAKSTQAKLRPAPAVTAKQQRRENFSADVGLDRPTTTDRKDTTTGGLSDVSELASELFTDEYLPLQMLVRSDNRLLFFRSTYLRGQRYLQGFFVDQTEFLRQTLASVYANSPLAAIGDLSVAVDGSVEFSIAATGGTSRTDYLESGSRGLVSGGQLLYRRYLPPPMESLELLFSARALPVATGSSLVLWSLSILLLLLCSGFILLYFLGKRQLQQRQQQQDFISAVSHELKTPLTSIRMYGEMLKSGWVTEDKRSEYYDYIYSESERLSRLINNVLQLSRVSRGQQALTLEPTSVQEMLDVVRSRSDAQLTSAGYTLQLDVAAGVADALALVDIDAFVQVMLNLIDNALKFSAGTEQQRVDLSARKTDRELVFDVRDYGPGIARDQLRKIFDLFYRSEDELTRETVGTGIGLALVQQLVTAMQGAVTARNMEPGAQFQVRLPLHRQET